MPDIGAFNKIEKFRITPTMQTLCLPPKAPGTYPAATMLYSGFTTMVWIIVANCGLIGRLMLTPEGNRRKNHRV